MASSHCQPPGSIACTPNGSSSIGATSGSDSSAASSTRRPSPRSGSRGALVPAGASGAASSGTSKPVRRIAAASVSRATGSRVCTVACSVARLTSASVTPGTFFRAFSTRATQEAQVMPSIGRVNSVWVRVCIIVTVPGYGSGRLSNVNLSGFE